MAVMSAPAPAPEGQPKAASSAIKLVGASNFKRHNPKSDKFATHGFHHVEFFCGDAINASRRFSAGLGMDLIAFSDQSTGNHASASHVAKSAELVFVFTAPYGSERYERQADAAAQVDASSSAAMPGYSQQHARDFFQAHGMAVRAVGVTVDDAADAFATSVANGARPVLPPTTMGEDEAVVAEVELYGEVVLRYVQLKEGFEGAFLPGYKSTAGWESGDARGEKNTFGIRRLDHAVGNVPDLLEVVNYVAGFTGFHEFAEFTAEDVGTVDSGLNSMVLANNEEMVLLPINEPTFGTRRKSQIQTYLEQNNGAGLQHLALKCDDLFSTLRAMRSMTHRGGFDFMPKPSKEYYANLPTKIGSALTKEQYAEAEELGMLVDKDDQVRTAREQRRRMPSRRLPCEDAHAGRARPATRSRRARTSRPRRCSTAPSPHSSSLRLGSDPRSHPAPPRGGPSVRVRAGRAPADFHKAGRRSSHHLPRDHPARGLHARGRPARDRAGRRLRRLRQGQLL